MGWNPMRERGASAARGREGGGGGFTGGAGYYLYTRASACFLYIPILTDCRCLRSARGAVSPPSAAPYYVNLLLALPPTGGGFVLRSSPVLLVSSCVATELQGC